jgi:hypothetical protein
MYGGGEQTGKVFRLPVDLVIEPHRHHSVGAISGDIDVAGFAQDDSRFCDAFLLSDCLESIRPFFANGPLPRVRRKIIDHGRRVGVQRASRCAESLGYSAGFHSCCLPVIGIQ